METQAAHADWRHVDTGTPGARRTRRDLAARRLAVRAGSLILAYGLGAGPAVALDIYRCPENGSVAYTSEPSGPSCRLVRFDVPEPDPAAFDRLERDRERWAAEEQSAREQARIERLIRVREMEAQAALRAARAAELQALNPTVCAPGYYPVPNFLASPVPYVLPPSFGAYYGNYRPKPGNPYRIELPSSSLGFTLHRR